MSGLAVTDDAHARARVCFLLYLAGGNPDTVARSLAAAREQDRHGGVCPVNPAYGQLLAVLATVTGQRRFRFA